MLKDKLQGVVIGVVVTAVAMTSIPAYAKTAQEAILVSYRNINLVIDGKQIQTENEPFIYNGRTYLPVRDIANAIGKEATWDGNTNTAYLGAVPAAVGQTNQTQPTQPSMPNISAGNDYVNYSSMDAYLKEKGITDKEIDNVAVEKYGKLTPPAFGTSGSISSVKNIYYLNYFLKPGMAFVPMHENNEAYTRDFPQGITVVEAKWEPSSRSLTQPKCYLVVEHNGRTYMSPDSYAKHRGYDTAEVLMGNSSKRIPNGQGWELSDINANYVEFIKLAYVRSTDDWESYMWGSLGYEVLPKDIAIFRDSGSEAHLQGWWKTLIDVEVADKYISSNPYDTKITSADYYGY